MQEGDNQPCHLTNSQVSVIQRVIPDQEHLHHLGTGENCELWDPTQPHGLRDSGQVDLDMQPLWGPHPHGPKYQDKSGMQFSGGGTKRYD